VRLTYPLPFAPAWFVAVADELFVNLNTIRDGPLTGFDQNRFFAGVGHHLTPHVRVEVAYLNQVLNGRRGSEDTLRNSGYSGLALTW
jgi:hypothetical protein